MVDLQKNNSWKEWIWTTIIFIIFGLFAMWILSGNTPQECDNLRIGIAREQKDGTYEMEIIEVCNVSEVEKYLK